MKKNSLIGIFFLFAICFAMPDDSLAQGGHLDFSFDTDGMVTTSVDTLNDYANSMAIQSDGKIVAAGIISTNIGDQFALVRYNTNGSLDTSFDSDGIVTTTIGNNYDNAFSVAIQSDGKILAGGFSYNGSNQDFALVRYNTNGSLDNTFDADGMVTTPLGTSDDYASSIAIQSDGKIVAAGFSNDSANYDFALARYNTNGSLDVTFDSDGKVTTSIGIAQDFAHSIAIQSDGKIVAGGGSGNGWTYNDFALVRYNTNGSLDNTFGSSGIVTTTFLGSNCEARFLILQSDGKIVAAGSARNGGFSDFALVRYEDCQVSITSQPTNQSVTISSNAQIITSASDSLASYQWQTDLGVGFQNLISVGQYSGTINDTLNIANTTLSNNNQLFRCVISLGSCADTSNAVVLTVINNISINEFSQSNLFSVYPNPASTEINVKADASLLGSVYTVYDNTGKLVLTGKINSENTTIELGNLSGGIYLFSVGENLKQTFKVIKE